MARPNRSEMAKRLLDSYGRTYSGELSIDIARNTPSPLFRWLVACLLFSARIRADAAASAAAALSKQGWRTPARMIDAGWRARTDVLNRAGYARYDESTSRMLEDTARLLQESYRGDLRRLREAAGRDSAEERRRLKAFKGIGDVGADLFFREMQAVWTELYPFADKRALQAADKLKLGVDARALSKLVSKQDFPRLLSALVRVDLDKGYDTITAKAA
ncbi:hypothetical protein [Microbaculum marinum]|uniref:Endonuclease n=1 Tax=Microbaculum marinum TaxID=1764581 RepID=A0AAW9S3P1_9HYPH